MDWIVEGFGDWRESARVIWIRATHYLDDLDEKAITELGKTVESAMVAGELILPSAYIKKGDPETLRPEIDHFFVTFVRILTAGLQHKAVKLPWHSSGNRLPWYRAYAAFALGLLMLALERVQDPPPVVASLFRDADEALERAGALAQRSHAGRAKSKDPEKRSALVEIEGLIGTRLKAHPSFPVITQVEAAELADQLFRDRKELVTKAVSPKHGNFVETLEARFSRLSREIATGRR